jgi:hypothetical protein
MNIIEHLQKNKNYLLNANKALHTQFDTIDIEFASDEIERILILHMDKGSYSHDEAFAILTMKQKMLNEEVEDLDLYDDDDVKVWAQTLLKVYQKSNYIAKINADELIREPIFERLQKKDTMHAIFENDKQLSYEQFVKINPCEATLLGIGKSVFARSEEEYYIETAAKFILLNWFSTI